MSSAENSPERPKPDARPDAADGESGDGLPLLDRILRQTLRRPDQGRPQVAEELQALVQVARRYPDQLFTVQPILEELIDALLGPQIAGLALSPAARRTMVAELARTLYDDAASRERLEMLWNSLLEQQP